MDHEKEWITVMDDKFVDGLFSLLLPSMPPFNYSPLFIDYVFTASHMENVDQDYTQEYYAALEAKAQASKCVKIYARCTDRGGAVRLVTLLSPEPIKDERDLPHLIKDTVYFMKQQMPVCGTVMVVVK